MINILPFIPYYLCFFCSKLVVSDSDNRITINRHEMIDFFYDRIVNKPYQYVEKWYEVFPEHKKNEILIDWENSRISSCEFADSAHHKNYETDFDEKKRPIITIERESFGPINGISHCELTNGTYNLEIYFRLRVNGTMPPQKILVNHIDLNLKKEDDIYTAEYFYRDGETVDVDCICSDEACTVQMRNPFNITDVNDEVSAWGFGFSTKLNSDHDQQKIECVSNYRDIKSTVKLTFVLQQKLNAHNIMVKINNQDITQNMMHYSNQYEVNYAYFYNNEYLTVKCDKNGIDTDVSCVNCISNKTEIITKVQSNEVTLIPNIMSIFKCTTKDEEEEVIIRFQLVSCRDDSQLIVDGLVRDNILSEYRAYKYRQGISHISYSYEYDNLNSLPLSCAINNINNINLCISLNNSGKNKCYSENSLSIRPSDKPVICLLHENTEKIVTEIVISFRFKSQPEMTLSTEGSDSSVKVIDSSDSGDHNDLESSKSSNDHNEEDQPRHEAWIPAIVVLMLIIIVCVIIIMYKMKIRICLKRRNPEHTYEYCEVNAVIQNYPAQNEAEYAVPEGEMQQNDLYHQTKDFYAKVIPKSQRPRNKQQSINAESTITKVFEEDAGSDFLIMNSLYTSACLEHNDRSEPTKSDGNNQETSKKASTNLGMLSDIYSEPINKKEKQEDTYTNVTDGPHYSNKIGGYCVYPTYSEPHIKK